MKYLNLQDLYSALREHYIDYGHGGCGLGQSLDWIVDEFIATGHSRKLIMRICNMAYYK